MILCATYSQKTLIKRNTLITEGENDEEDEEGGEERLKQIKSK